ncbi:MAG: long-chain fatty acid--CoA ligase [Prevotellaceae bacterium]|jgi:long-chain acyl-CoA synthetase|nr:long-chain fatty acid--CoA ligase [Prevotellaceae bacterium]
MEYVHLGKLIFEQAKKYGERSAIKYQDQVSKQWKELSWNKFSERVKIAAKSLIEIGIPEESKVAIFAQNMAEIIEIDFACHATRLVSVPMYATSSASQVEYIVNDAGIGLIFVGEQYQYDKAVEVLHTSKHLKKIVAIDKKIDLRGVDAAITYENFLLYGKESGNAETVLDERMSRLSANDLANLLYTSGTTGEAKGVMLHHSNYQQAIKIHYQRISNVTDRDVSLCFLPLSHVFERAWTYFCFYKGILVVVNHAPQEIQTTIKEIRPTTMCAVPRFWEKVYAGVNEKIDSFSPFARKLARRAIEIGRRRNLDYKRTGKNVPPLLNLQYLFYDKTLFQLLKKAIGIENGKLFPCAGSQLSDEVNIFLHSVGINLCVGYGLTESTATVSCYNVYNKDYDISTVGDIMPEVEVKIGENNEILIKGKTITKGYYNKPEITAGSFEDGWFKTGDAGRITKEGRLVITERIKDLFKTSNGKYIAPQQIENKLIVDKYIEQVAIIGDDRKYVSALIVPAFDALKAYAQQAKIKYGSMEDLLKNKKIIEFYEGRIKRIQADLASFEQVKKFVLLSQPFTAENNELTLTLKLRRKVINQNYAGLIDEMYY